MATKAKWTMHHAINRQGQGDTFIPVNAGANGMLVSAIRHEVALQEHNGPVTIWRRGDPGFDEVAAEYAS